MSASLIASVAIVRPASLQAPAASSSNRIHAIWIDMKAGWSFIVHHAAILFFVIAMAAGLFTIGCFGPLISIYVRDTLHASAGLFGYVSGMVGVGLLLGTQIIRQVAKKASDTGLVLWGLVGIGGGVLLLGAVPHIAATLAATFTIGFAFAAIMVPAQTLIQRETPPDMLGRVGSTNASVVFLGQVLGLAVSGAAGRDRRRADGVLPVRRAVGGAGDRRADLPAVPRSRFRVFQDLRYALRAFAGNPGFTAAAIVSLAIGIGANTSIFSAASALLLRPLPYQDASRLVILWNRSPGLGIAEDWFSTAQYADIADGHQGFEQLAIAIGNNVNITGDGEPERIGTVRVSSNLLPMLGARPALGRLFVAAEDRAGAAPVAVLNYGTWMRRYGGDRAVLDRTLTLNGVATRVVGVLPASFSLPREVMPTLGGAAGEAELLLTAAAGAHRRVGAQP